MSISRDTFDPAKNYKRVRYHQDRDLLDSELNEAQDIAIHERKKIADLELPGMPHLGSGISWKWKDASGRERTVMATPNLNGDYLSDACAAQVGGLGLMSFFAFFHHVRDVALELSGMVSRAAML